MNKSLYIKSYLNPDNYLIKLNCSYNFYNNGDNNENNNEGNNKDDNVDDNNNEKEKGKDDNTLYYSKYKLYNLSKFLQNQYDDFGLIPDFINLHFSKESVIDFLYFIDKRFILYDEICDFESFVSIFMYLDITLENMNAMYYDVLQDSIFGKINEKITKYINNLESESKKIEILNKYHKKIYQKLYDIYINKYKHNEYSWIYLLELYKNQDDFYSHCINILKQDKYYLVNNFDDSLFRVIADKDLKDPPRPIPGIMESGLSIIAFETIKSSDELDSYVEKLNNIINILKGKSLISDPNNNDIIEYYIIPEYSNRNFYELILLTDPHPTSFNGVTHGNYIFEFHNSRSNTIEIYEEVVEMNEIIKNMIN